ncbi:hypothetical protein E2562_020640 [Oryza meyeriana var. granulata]|uniref:Uncharacterized protein n=1 Tax=Oryza meyeriana var. granulata TaxID=110450 RepID=A0A6G1EDE0_9ORYZ|nr:hypothetical protein E2562_020640 [Oryza meyeriana var. granulata]
MRKPNTSRDEYYHCNRTDDQENHFFKVMIDDFRERMIIPDKFAHHFKGLLGEWKPVALREDYYYRHYEAWRSTCYKMRRPGARSKEGQHTR